MNDMMNVVQFHNEEDESIAEVLQYTQESHEQGLIKQLVVIGVTQEGHVSLGYSKSEILKVLGLLEAAKQQLFYIMEDDE